MIYNVTISSPFSSKSEDKIQYNQPTNEATVSRAALPFSSIAKKGKRPHQGSIHHLLAQYAVFVDMQISFPKLVFAIRCMGRKNLQDFPLAEGG